MAPPPSLLMCLSLFSAWALLLLLETVAPAAAQLNTEPWPSSDGYADVSEKHIPVAPGELCDDVIGRFSFTQPKQVFVSQFQPFNATKGNRPYCDGPPWQGVGLEASFQTTYFVPANGIVGVWIGGVEIMRGYFPTGRTSASFYPDFRGTKRWTIEKSVTQFYSLMRAKQTVKVSVVYDDRGNDRYRPVLNATFTLRYYRIEPEHDDKAATFPPVVRPISRGGVNTAPWFTLATGGIGNATLTLPRNMVSASIEVIGSKAPEAPFNRNENEGRDKQVQVLVDGVTAGFAYVGFVEEDRLHEPLPLSYSLDITPLVGRLVDGKPHTFALKNPHQQLLLVGANVFIYVDGRVNRTSGAVLQSSSSGPFQLVDNKRESPDGTVCPVDESPYYSCSRKSSAGVEYVNVTQTASLVWEGESGYCSGLDIDLLITQQTSRGNTPTRSTSVGRTESVFAIHDRSCQDLGCSYYATLDSLYSVRRTRKRVLLRKQYHRTYLQHSDVSRGYPDYSYDPCDYSEDSSSEFVYADYEDARCFTLNTTNEYDTTEGTYSTSKDTVKCPPRK
eukprot:jgi/Chlat1/1838/Chrsp14S00776